MMESLVESAATRARYIAVWRWLIVLLIIGLAASALPISRLEVIILVFGVAAIKAILVARDYMHLKAESLLIHAIVIVPIILFIALLLALIPDIALRR
jgi:caa(3)-type oxidase subunit IV